MAAEGGTQRVRIDKWLWAARFFKTRNLAKQAIEGGKVHLGGQRVKASKEIELGALLSVRQGWDEKVVCVTGLAEQRRDAATAAGLYRETEASVAARELRAAQRRAQGAAHGHPPSKPNSKQRRQIQQAKRDLFETDPD